MEQPCRTPRSAPRRSHTYKPIKALSMAIRTCRVRHCNEPASSQFSPHCRRHKSTLRRHGDPEQRGVTLTELKPFLARVRARIAKNDDSPLWTHLENLWRDIVSDARQEVTRPVGNRYQRSAANELLNVDADSSPMEIIVTTLAMHVFWHDRPNRFRSDSAFWLQLARRVRALTSRHCGLRYDHETGRDKRIYREMTPKAGAIIGQKLSSTFGAVGFQFAALDKRDREEADKAKDAIANAIRELR